MEKTLKILLILIAFAINVNGQDFWLNDSIKLDRSFHMAKGTYDIQPFFDSNGMMWGQGEADNVGISFVKTDSAQSWKAKKDGYLFFIPTYQGKVNIHGIINKMGNELIGSMFTTVDEKPTIYGTLMRGVYSQENDSLISRHSEYHKALESAARFAGSADATRKGYYEVIRQPDGSVIIKQPIIEMK